MKTKLPTGETGNLQARSGDRTASFGRGTAWAWNRRRAATCLVSGLLFLTGLAGCDHEQKPAPVVVKSVEDRFAIKVGDRVVQAQVAALADEMEHGLMFRQSMGEDEGMIFVFAKPQAQSFWMRNTTLPLDIGYFDETGELKEIYPMYPLDERPVASHSKGIQFCLEMNQGWFKRAGVKPGDKLDLKAVAEALRARGLKPEAVGLN
jgi:uncharacterized membrane protein (UPF0127 family)